MPDEPRGLKRFGVKLGFVSRVEGPPAGTDADYEPGWVLLEERVLLIPARSFEEAIELAERQARDYEDEHTNPYGERVRCRYTGNASAFELYEPDDEEYPEVFSLMRVLREKQATPEKLANVFLGQKRDTLRRRRRFLNAELAGRVTPKD